mmetsp:Transcript_12819/g.26179  ORF Transcript_12819/g.26179 Transcript_12819/m.26179 type:complete len:214 (+) Transcript_12819:1642-2283(+)
MASYQARKVHMQDHDFERDEYEDILGITYNKAEEPRLGHVVSLHDPKETDVRSGHQAVDHYEEPTDGLLDEMDWQHLLVIEFNPVVKVDLFLKNAQVHHARILNDDDLFLLVSALLELLLNGISQLQVSLDLPVELRLAVEPKDLPYKPIAAELSDDLCYRVLHHLKLLRISNLEKLSAGCLASLERQELCLPRLEALNFGFHVRQDFFHLRF